tara:strand:- start:16162 stop:16497 length:336 start_codon:yes stop_codon:yes gene_type:complete
MSDDKNAELEVLKQVVSELRTLNERIASVEGENFELRKAVSDPETMMRKAGWLKIVTPHADETFDPLNRAVVDGAASFNGPFTGSGEVFQKSKSRYDELQDWIDAEEASRT